MQEEIEASRHQHRVKSAMLRESAKNLEGSIATMKKEEKRVASVKKRELKYTKKKELQQI